MTKYTVILVKKNENLFDCKRFSHFPTKIIFICNIYILDFNETLTNYVVNVEQPVPGV